MHGEIIRKSIHEMKQYSNSIKLVRILVIYPCRELKRLWIQKTITSVLLLLWNCVGIYWYL